MSTLSNERLIELLNEDLSHEYSAIIQYLTYAARVKGPYRPQLKAFFEAEIADETMHAQFLASKVVALGGVPTTNASPVKDAKDAKSMLEAVIEAETGARARYIERAAQAEQLGLKGLQVQLEDMVRDETTHMEETQRILDDWGL
ncbi:MAG: ferritin-like domain-containing protein [Planctomycetota bacterium]